MRNIYEKRDVNIQNHVPVLDYCILLLHKFFSIYKDIENFIGSISCL